MKLFWFGLVLISKFSIASIFNGDDRKDFYEIQDEKIKELSRSIPSLIQKNKLEKTANGYKVKAKTLENGFNFCPDARFAKEFQLANCSASLIAEDLVLTAAHCLNEDENNQFHPSQYVVVFDYKKENKNSMIESFPAENVYEIESKMPLFVDDFFKTMVDIAVIKLKRKVKNRKPIKLDLSHNYNINTSLFVLGYPLGVSQKLTDDSEIIAQKASPNSFRHHLDTFSVNSGSAVFDANTNKIIGVHVRGTGSNFTEYGRECREWFVGDESKDYGEANMLKPVSKKLRKLLRKSIF